MHDFYKVRRVSELQQKLFKREYFPTYVKTPQAANIDFVRGEGELIPIADCVGRMALEGALPYPPGVFACSRVNFGRKRLVIISWPLKKALMNYRVLHRSFKAFILKRMKPVISGLMRMY